MVSQNQLVLKCSIGASQCLTTTNIGAYTSFMTDDDCYIFGTFFTNVFARWKADLEEAGHPYEIVE